MAEPTDRQMHGRTPSEGVQNVSLIGGVPYPCTVFRTRYGGVYEGGEWGAFQLAFIPPDAFGDDPTCADWWRRAHESLPVGVGDTPEAAIAALIEKLHKAYDL